MRASDCFEVIEQAGWADEDWDYIRYPRVAAAGGRAATGGRGPYHPCGRYWSPGGDRAAPTDCARERDQGERRYRRLGRMLCRHRDREDRWALNPCAARYS